MEARLWERACLCVCVCVFPHAFILDCMCTSVCAWERQTETDRQTEKKENESLWVQRKTNSRKWRKFTQPTLQSSRSCSIYKDSKPSLHVCVCVCTQEHVFMWAVCVCVSAFQPVCVCVCVRASVCLCVCVKINKYAQLKASCYLAVKPEEVILWYTDNFGQNTGL